MKNHFVDLSGLKPATAYYFIIKDSEGTSERFWFKTFPNDPKEPLSIIAGGDSRINQTTRQKANKMVAKLRPHAIIFAGDMTDQDSGMEWINWFNDWQYTIIGKKGWIYNLIIK